MNAPKAPTASWAEKPFIFNSTEGHALCCHILKELRTCSSRALGRTRTSSEANGYRLEMFVINPPGHLVHCQVFLCILSNSSAFIV